jgi:hypothetical protein
MKGTVFHLSRSKTFATNITVKCNEDLPFPVFLDFLKPSLAYESYTATPYIFYCIRNCYLDLYHSVVDGNCGFYCHLNEILTTRWGFVFLGANISQFGTVIMCGNAYMNAFNLTIQG